MLCAELFPFALSAMDVSARSRKTCPQFVRDKPWPVRLFGLYACMVEGVLTLYCNLPPEQLDAQFKNYVGCCPVVEKAT